MPVHFNSILNEQNKGSEELQNSILNGILQNDLQNPDDVFVNKDKNKFTITKYIMDINKNEKVGKSVITMMTNEEQKVHEVIDIDLTLLSDKPVKLNFENKLDKSSDSNEYYDVIIDNNDVHCQIETVNRLVKEEKSIIGTAQDVYISIFPFQLNVFNTIEDFNKEYVFSKPIKVGKTNFEVHGYSEEFAGPGGMLRGNTDEICSFIIGKVVSYKDITGIIGGIKVPFTIIKLKTAFGIVPVAASRDTFDLSNLSENKIIVMFADVKVDFLK